MSGHSLEYNERTTTQGKDEQSRSRLGGASSQSLHPHINNWNNVMIIMEGKEISGKSTKT